MGLYGRICSIGPQNGPYASQCAYMHLRSAYIDMPHVMRHAKREGIRYLRTSISEICSHMQRVSVRPTHRHDKYVVNEYEVNEYFLVPLAGNRSFAYLAGYASHVCPMCAWCTTFAPIIQTLAPVLHPPLEKPPNESRINPKPIPTKHTTSEKICEFPLHNKRGMCCA